MSVAERLLPLLGAVPPFLLLWFAERFERRVNEPTVGWRYRVLVAGGLASLPVLLIGRLLRDVMAYTEEPLTTFYDAFIVGGTLEESAKAACVMLLTRGALAPRTRYGAFLYALHATMGFAVVENVIALFGTPDIETFHQRFVLRAYLSVPMHLAAGSFMGYAWARSRFGPYPLGWPGGLALAILLHGSFNAMLHGLDRLPESEDVLRSVIASGVFALPLLGIALLFFFVHRLRDLDRRDEEKKPRGRRSSAGMIDAP